MDRPRRQLTGVLLAGLLAGAPLAGGACRPADAAADRRDPVDRPVPRAIALARFRQNLVEPAGLGGGAHSRDALITRFIQALAARDTAALGEMVLTRAEFAWLYYPTSPQGRPPYDLAPDLMWFLLQGNHEKGLRAVLAERAGRNLAVVGYRCDPLTSREGANTITGPCLVQRLQGTGDTLEERLFGLVIERGGRFKFVSYANKL